MKLFRLYLELWKKSKLLFILVVSGIILVGAGSAMYVGYVAVSNGVFGEIPSDDELKAIKNYQASEIYSADSVLLGRYYVENRTEVMYDNVSHFVIDALIATEDARFYGHKGIDQRSMMRVLFKSVILGQNTGGGSTLSQQLAKNLFGRENYGFLSIPVNKSRELIIANKLEHLYSKEEILMLYLNTISFGENTYGIELACQRFFSTTPKDISIEQAATLIGMLKATSTYNPRINLGKSLERRNTVISQMAKYGYISSGSADSLSHLPLTLAYNKLSHDQGSATYFREYLRLKLENWLKDNDATDSLNLYTSGLKIYTTLHSRLQKYAEESVHEHLQYLQPLLHDDFKKQGLFEQNESVVLKILKQSDRYKQLLDQGISETKAIEKLRKPIQTTLYTYDGIIDTLVSVFDSVRHDLGMLQAGFLVVNPHNGKVMAWVGGASYEHTQYDHITAQRQVGSVFKPIVYAQAMMDGYQPCDFISNQKIIYTQYEDWSPKNSDGNYEGKYSLVGALTNSVNTVSVKLAMESGIESIIKLSRNMGVEGQLPNSPSIALGAGNISLKSLIHAYTAFANSGKTVGINYITSVKTRDGKEIYFKEPSGNQVLPVEISQNITNMLRSVVDNGTAKRIRYQYGITGNVAGKTGTTQNHTDGWFVGYTPDWLGGVWVGVDNPIVHFSGIKNGQGANTALPIWALFYKKIENDKELYSLVKSEFQFPNSIDCEPYKEDSPFLKLFKRKEKRNNNTGINKDNKFNKNSNASSPKKRKRKGWLKNIFDGN
ncbi:transglycosylase domain-containing protein [Reichenbachiella sp. MALMAid0571]|uniref:transglycosylase domain-containing protein n=1 Tax=Reichenbachiella sp. MALMAid0571 TaxID=3143939 RepID=UPI0032DEDFF8